MIFWSKIYPWTKSPDFCRGQLGAETKSDLLGRAGDNWDLMRRSASFYQSIQDGSHWLNQVSLSLSLSACTYIYIYTYGIIHILLQVEVWCMYKYTISIHLHLRITCIPKGPPKPISRSSRRSVFGISVEYHEELTNDFGWFTWFTHHKKLGYSRNSME